MSAWSTRIRTRPTSANPLVRLVLAVFSLFQLLLGNRQVGTLEDDGTILKARVTEYILWVLAKSEVTLSVKRCSIVAVEIGTSTPLFIYRLFISRKTVCVIHASGVGKALSYEVRCPIDEIRERSQDWIA